MITALIGIIGLCAGVVAVLLAVAVFENARG